WKLEPGFPRVPRSLGSWEVALENFASLSPAEKAALPPVVFVETLADALGLSQEHPATTFVTRRRELVRGSLARAVTAPPEASRLYARRRGWEELRAKTADERSRLDAVERTIEENRRGRASAESGLPALRERERAASAVLSALDGRLEERRAERDRLR